MMNGTLKLKKTCFSVDDIDTIEKIVIARDEGTAVIFLEPEKIWWGHIPVRNSTGSILYYKEAFIMTVMVERMEDGKQVQWMTPSKRAMNAMKEYRARYNGKISGKKAKIIKKGRGFQTRYTIIDIKE